MSNKLGLALCLLGAMAVAFACSSGDGADADGRETLSATAAVGFAQDVLPIFQAKCVPCHEAEHASLDTAVAFQFASLSIEEILSRVGPEEPAGGATRMPLAVCGGPPGFPNCLTEEEYETLVAWQEGGLRP